MTDKQAMSRRNFLKGALFGTAAVASSFAFGGDVFYLGESKASSLEKMGSYSISSEWVPMKTCWIHTVSMDYGRHAFFVPFYSDSKEITREQMNISIKELNAFLCKTIKEVG